MTDASSHTTHDDQKVNVSHEKKDRFLLRVWLWIRHGFQPAGRYGRYSGVIATAMLIIWTPVIMYTLTAPAVYTSGFTLILPGAGVGSSINLNDLGQATTATASPYSSSTLSPTQKYKRLLVAERTLEIAAKSLDMDAKDFPAPRIKLIDQTELIIVILDGPSVEAAFQRADALHKAFDRELVRLRRNETQEREKAQKTIIEDLQGKVVSARADLLQAQTESGLQSGKQFEDKIQSLDTMKNDHLALQANHSKLVGEIDNLSKALEIDVPQATRAFILKSDTLFQDLLKRLSVNSSKVEEMTVRFGKRHPKLVTARSDYKGIRLAVERRGEQLTGLTGTRLMSLTDLTVSEQRAKLFVQLISKEAERAGLFAEIKTIGKQISNAESRVSSLADDASKLDTLARDLQVAEAVFSSALARLDTNKSDIFASYPLAQTFEGAKRPQEASGPKRIFAVIGGVAATIFLFAGLGLAWLRQPILAKLLPNA